MIEARKPMRIRARPVLCASLLGSAVALTSR